MGLDQIAYAVVRTRREGREEAWDARSSSPEQGPGPDDTEALIASWRKHNRLHGWMENLWESRGRPNWDGEKKPLGDFNNTPLELTWTDIEQLEAHVLNKELPETLGFFFGEDSFTDFESDEEDSDGAPPAKNSYYYKNADLIFIANARRALQEGKAVFYDSWW